MTVIILFPLRAEHSMADTLGVALRVAEEAIDEAISKAEFHSDSQVLSSTVAFFPCKLKSSI